MEKLFEYPVDPLELAEDLLEKRKTVAQVLSDITFIRETEAHTPALRNYLMVEIIIPLGRTLFLGKKVEHEGVEKVAAALKRLSVYMKTGTIPSDAIDF